MRHIIIGGSIAGISAAKALRAGDAGAEITLISAEMVKPYYRPMIPSLIEKADAEITFSENLISTYRIRTVYDKATGIDPQRREVTILSGERLPYDKVLIATGSRAVMPEVAGIAGRNVYPFRTQKDANDILAAARSAKYAAVLGGGFVGIKAAIALRRMGLAVTIVEKLDRILYEKLDRRGSALIADLLRDADIDIVTNQTDFEIVRETGTPRSLRLASGRIIDADVIVSAVGTRPNTESFVSAGIRMNRGILVGESLETNVPGVYAAGDVVEYRDLVSNALAVSSLWTNAEEMGRIAGKNMTGEGLKYTGFLSLMNTVEILGVPVTTIGLIDPAGSGYEISVNEAGGAYRKLVFKNNILVGALFIGKSERTGLYTHLIKNRTPLGKLKNPVVKGKLSYIDFLNSAEGVFGGVSPSAV